MLRISLLSYTATTRKILRLALLFNRKKSSLGLWDNELTTEIKLKIEHHWKDEVLQKLTRINAKESYYVLPMFPYPSGNLHMGHVRVYSISDAIARCQYLFGKSVIHPMGWDAFGLPAENAAIERNIPPDQWTKSNVETMKSQLHQLAFNFDWHREISTCDPNYYKWTQYIFLKLFEKGLVYQDEALVNWDPVDKTVLADEQVDDSGHSWRSGALVEKKNLKQWFVRTTAFAKNLYEGLSDKTLENWKDIINLQKHWIGECNGISVQFKMKVGNNDKIINVWTSEPCKLLYSSFLTIRSDHSFMRKVLSKCSESDASKVQLTAVNPITNTELPVYITDHAPYAEGQQVYLASPEIYSEDIDLAHTLNITVSKEISVIDKEAENQKATDLALQKNFGGYFVSSKLKDWLISRQRYWGTPIPIVHCSDCGVVPVSFDKLPVELPVVNHFKSGIQTLKEEPDWVNCLCPKCGRAAKRETDTMDTFVDSSWYYYRFLDPNNNDLPFDKNKTTKNTPVNMYIGGKEHAVLHLYYARFMAHFLHSLGWTNHPEPFKKLIVQGMVMGQSYKVKSTGKYIPPDQVYKDGDIYKEKETNNDLIVQWEKMSKSKYNGENPERLLAEYGCDTTRLFILADVPPATSRNWSDTTFPGVLNWQHRLWITIRDFIKYKKDINNITKILSEEENNAIELKLSESRNYFIATTTFHFKHTQKLSVGISRLQGLTNTLRNKIPSSVVSTSIQYEWALANLVTMLYPLAPHFCSELWSGLQSVPNKLTNSSHQIDWNEPVHNQTWPDVDNDFKLSFLCKVDGKDICDLKIEASKLSTLTEASAIQLMLEQESIKKKLTRGLAKTKYELYPGCRAILNLFVNKKKTADKITLGK